MKMIQSHQSPNFDERELPISMLLLHYTGMPSGEEALERLCDPEAKVSAHYLVEEDGRIFQLVEEDKRAWHGGVGYWRGITDINSASIGIEIVNPGHEWGYRAFPNVQMEAVIALCQDILGRHDIAAHDVVGHSDIAPARKQDPGELFDWERLAGEGIGLWSTISHAALDAASSQGDHPVSSTECDKLADYGYAIENSEKTILAFQRHFRPALLNGKWDGECASILASLLEQA